MFWPAKENATFVVFFKNWKKKRDVKSFFKRLWLI